MRKPALGRKIVVIVTMASLAVLAFALAVVLFPPVSASASATSTKSRTTTSTTAKKKKTTKKKTTKKKQAASPTATTASPPLNGTDTTATDPLSKAAAAYFVINGTANAATDHEIVGSSAFPNYTTGAVDNYYSLAHSHVDNSPFAEGTASPADTGPIGQTAAAGNFQQPQYADARWPGDSGKATYGTQGQPYATADASAYKATAESSEASSGLSGPGTPTLIAGPKGFDGRLRKALAAWRAKWLDRLEPKRPKAPKLPVVKPPTLTVTTPAGTLTTPTVSLPTPSAPLGGVKVAPPVTAPSTPAPTPTPPALPSALAPHAATPSRSLSSSSGDGVSLLDSTTQSLIDPATGALVTKGESSLGHVSIGGGQIVVDGIHVSASITNDGTNLKDKTAVTVGAATIGGVPVSIDQDGVHINGQTQGLPYQQASDALNGALKQAGIQLYLVGPQIVNNSCGASGTSPTSTDQSSTTTGTTSASTAPTSTDQTSTNPSASSCGQSGMDMSGSCGQATTSSPTTTSSGPLGTTPSTTTTGTTTTTTSTDQTSTDSTASSCDQTGTTPTASSCPSTGTATTTTTSTDQSSTGTTDTTSTDQSGGGYFGAATANPGSGSGEETVTATGLHVLFTQPVDQSGVPAQFAEHILGEVFLDSLAVPAPPVSATSLGLAGSTSTTASSSGPCGSLGGKSRTSKTSGFSSNGTGGSSAGGSTSSGSSSLTGSGTGSSQTGSAGGLSGGVAQPTSGSAGGGSQSFPARIVAALKKPLWLLLAYLVWQALVIGTGASLWHWRKGDVA